MEIVEIIPPYLYSVKYDDEQLDEYSPTFIPWMVSMSMSGD